jgi:hypothetical protein
MAGAAASVARTQARTRTIRQPLTSQTWLPKPSTVDAIIFPPERSRCRYLLKTASSRCASLTPAFCNRSRTTGPGARLPLGGVAWPVPSNQTTLYFLLGSSAGST